MQNCNSKFKIIKVLFIVLIFNFSLLTFNLSSASAQTMSNNNYILEYSGLNQAAGTMQGNSYSVGFTVGGEVISQSGLDNSGYNKGNNLVNQLKNHFLTFSVSELFIDFGILSPTNPITRTNAISIQSDTPYSVLAYEEHELTSGNGNVIPNTTCDQGVCNTAIPGKWESTLTYGFGYRCDNVVGSLCATDFTTNSFYKSFPNADKNLQLQTLLKGDQKTNVQTAQITYKVNVSGTQSVEPYKTIVHYIAVPTY